MMTIEPSTMGMPRSVTALQRPFGFASQSRNPWPRNVRIMSMGPMAVTLYFLSMPALSRSAMTYHQMANATNAAIQIKSTKFLSPHKSYINTSSS